MVLNLDPNFKPVNGEDLPFESFVFNGGEPHIRIGPGKNFNKVLVTHRINSFNDLGLLCIAVDALKRMDAKEINVIIPYFPGARQDRVMVKGESLTVKVYASIINNLKLNSITIFDPHSDVTPALLENCISIQNHDFIKHIISQIPKHTILISPDAGASKKIFKLAKALNFENIIECGKKRNVITGELSGFTVPIEDIQDKPCLMVDDICDGGGTFLGLAEELKSKNAGKLFLAVSHGIFSKGISELSSMFENIFTTDSIKSMDESEITQIDLNKILNLHI
jgi:ribose-phosphate pyrophosphokinase